MMFVKPINELRKDDVLLAGGKGASLGELVSAGALVPPGYVVTSHAYKAFLEYNGLDKEVAKLDSGQDDPLDLARRIKGLVLASPLPPDLASELEKVADKFRHDFLAVRSSATYEDSPSFSFAGVHDTYLGVKGAEVARYVKMVWASNFEDRSITYKLNNKIPPSRVLMAVVVQKLVNPKAAGVAFSLDPVKGDPSVVSIEASWGLGEAVVGGYVTPDKYYVSKVTGEILRKDISPGKTKRFVLREGRVVEEDVEGSEASSPSLTDEEVLAIANTVVKLEKYYGYFVDVEWAVEGDKVYTLQSRPETVWSKKWREMRWQSSGDLIKDIVMNLLSMKVK